MSQGTFAWIHSSARPTSRIDDRISPAVSSRCASRRVWPTSARFPGAEAAERARTERAAATYARLAELADETRLLRTRFRTQSADGGTAADRAALLRSRASVQDEAARLLEELSSLEPELADGHHARADETRAAAAADLEFAALLALQDTPAPTP
ncbi:hypothetical protein [Streptomyces phaeochromogenes]